MRQGNGSEILGANDPRSAEIGIIHVSPLDDRQSVLAAILTQERLSRKQVVVVLPEDNKAFQRPIDFDGLKNKRRELQAEIIFVTPSGPGPALLARQRHFPVYSSLENYASSLKDAGAGQSQEGKSFRPGRLFSRRQKQETPAAAPSPSIAPAQPAPVILQPFPPVAVPDTTAAQHGRTAEATFAAASPDSYDNEMLSANRDEMEMPVDQHNGTGMSVEDEEDDLAMPPVILPPDNEPDPAPVARSDSANADLVSARSGRGPNIIELSPRRTGTTGKIPVPAAQPDPQPINLAKKQGNSGKMAAIGTIGAIGGIAAATAGAFSARNAAPDAATGNGMSAATMAQTATGGSPIPPHAGTGGPGGPGGPARNTGRNWLVAAGLIVLTLLLVFGGIAYAAPGVLNHFSNIVPGNPNASTATITITPATKTKTASYDIFAVTGKPTAAARQVQARILTANPSKSQTVTATGVNKTPGARSTGTLTFYNGSTSAFTVAAGTVFATGSGIQLVNDTSVTIPGQNPPNDGVASVSAHAVNVGASGNIPALAIDGTCCVGGNYIIVKNLNAFSGGQDPQNYTFLQQSDVDGVATPLKQQLMTSAQANVNGQKRSGEQFVNASNNPVSCSPTVTANPPVGSKTSSATVTVQVSCSGEVYNQQAAQAMAASIYKSDSTVNPGSGFVLTGNVSTSLKQASLYDNKGTILLVVDAQGTWVYQTSLLKAQESSWAKQIAGKSKQQAITFLQSQTGVGTVSIQFSGNTLPTAPGQITFVVQNVPVTGSPTPTGPGTTPVSGTPSSGTPTPTPTSQNGLGSSN